MKNFWITIPGNLHNDNLYNNNVILESEAPQENHQVIPRDQVLNFISFLKFLHFQKEFEVYYFLFNKAEIKSFKSTVLEISCNKNTDRNLIKQISNLLSLWKKEQCSINISKQEVIIPFKSIMISEVKSDSNWDLIKKNFPNATISDLILGL